MEYRHSILWPQPIARELVSANIALETFGLNSICPVYAFFWSRLPAPLSTLPPPPPPA